MTASSIERHQRLSGGLVGLLVGDALGVPYEFAPPEAIPPAEQIEFSPPAGFQRAHFGAPLGTDKDDHAQALILLDSWLHEDGYALTRPGFDIEPKASAASNRPGIAPESSGLKDESQNRNGSLIRELPVSLWQRGDAQSSMVVAARQLLPTH